ncbi:MAG: NAD-dependent protein deacylase [Treponemataceae bacterium]|nr:NAD-dependent protein deacylase [Treponemataceae bacterium]
MVIAEEIDEQIENVQKLYDNSKNIVFFGGAGVSTESGIPDFRSQDGLYSQKWKYPPETIISRSFFDANPAEFYRFYREKLIIKDVKPNIAHSVLAKMEEIGKLSAIVTQNIDGLHQMAGSKNVFELHGSTLRNYCMKCGEFYNVDFIAESGKTEDAIPHCKKCGGLVKPDVVLYGEGLDQKCIEDAKKAISEADLLIIGGTSLVVYPAAGLIDYFRGENIVLINKSRTASDEKANLVIHNSIGKVLGSLKLA